MKFVNMIKCLIGSIIISGCLVKSQTFESSCEKLLQNGQSRPCRLPSDDPHMLFCPVGCGECLTRGRFCHSPPGSLVPHHTRVQCGTGYRLQTDQDYHVVACDNGTWFGEFPQCLAQCPPLESDSVFPRCLSGAREVDCSKPMMPRTTATVQCRPSHAEYPNLAEAGVYKRTMSCRYSGLWSHSLPECKPVCGVSKGSTVVQATVMDGKDTPLGVFPWHAALYQRELDKESNQTSWKYICGGSLITTRVVLTAAHCCVLEKSDLQLAFAKYFRKWGEEFDEDYTVKRNVSAISLPREFDWAVNTLAWDIALILMDQAVQVNSYVMPVCRSPSLKLEFEKTPKGYVVGWGKTGTGQNSDILQHNDISIMPYNICNRKIPRAVAVDKFCGSKNSASVVGKGDSGGGLTAVIDNQHHLVGIVSVKYGDISVFTNVSWAPHTNWVESQIINFEEDVTRCSGYTFQCGLYGPCLERSVRCNGWRDCPDGSDEIGCPAITSHRPDGADGESCQLPSQPASGRYRSLQCSVAGDRRPACQANARGGATVPAFWLIEYTCDDGYAVNSTRSTRSTCESGVWSNPLECVIQCPGLDAAFTDLSCEYNGEGVSCRDAVLAGTTAVATCRSGYRRPDDNAPSMLQCLATGRWSKIVENCTPVQCPGLSAANVDISCDYNGQSVSCRDAVRAGTMAVATCRSGFRRPGSYAPLSLQCLATGIWSKEVENCMPAKVPDEPPGKTKNNTGGVNRLHLYLGDVCKIDRGDVSTCQFLKDCPAAIAELRSGRKPSLCNFHGGSAQPVVCCDKILHLSTTPMPGSPTPQATGQDAYPQGEQIPDELAGEHPPLPPTLPGEYSSSSSQAFGALSKQKCNEYAGNVYLRLPDPNGDGPNAITTIDSCAAFEPLIVNGRDAQPREYPHMALVGFGNKDSILWLCGGSLISERFVLTTAHCLDPKERFGSARWVRLGEYNLGSQKDEENGLSQMVDYEIDERIPHPEFSPPSIYNDIALLKLNREVEFNEFIRPACIHTEENITHSYGVATGWGQTYSGGPASDIVQKVNLTIIPNEKCASDWSKNDISKKAKDGILDKKMICAGDNKKDTCSGDAGGPLQLRLKAPYCMYSIIGITSVGAKCGGNLPSIYTRVSYYVPWIEAVVWPAFTLR